MHGGHVIKSWSTNQATIALSSGEAEYYGMVEGASQAMGLRAVAEDIGVSFTAPIQINTDASAAIGMANWTTGLLTRTVVPHKHQTLIPPLFSEVGEELGTAL